MTLDTYWPQQQLFLYATCALFPEKLTEAPLDSQQMNKYITSYFDEDLHLKLLQNMQAQGLLNVLVKRDAENKPQYLISNIAQSEFRQQLIEYLDKYRNDELVATPPYKPEDFDRLKMRLDDYLAKSSREKPLVTISNIWQNWNGTSTTLHPFWEIILTSELISGDNTIHDIGILPAERGAMGRPEIPYAKLVVVNKPKAKASNSDTASLNRTRAWAKINRGVKGGLSVDIEIENGDTFILKDSFKTDMAPIALLSYLIDHPSKPVDLAFANKRIEGCENTKDLGETLRQCGFNRELKRLFFDKHGKKLVQIKQDVTLNSSEIASIRKI